MNKHMAAWHEAGHAVVARHLGLPFTQAGIWQKEYTSRNGSKFKMWEGETKAAYGWLTPHKQRIVSVAGSVAVYCADMIEDRSPESDWELMFDEIADRMSESDWTVNYEGRNVTDDPGTISEARWRAWYKAMKQAYALLNPETGPLWRELQREQRKLLRRNLVCTFALPNKVAA
jgi:hypothetical protein